MKRAQKGHLREMVCDMAVLLAHENGIVILKHGSGLIDADHYEAVAAVWLHDLRTK